MWRNKFWFTFSGILVVLATALMLPTRTEAASTYKVIHVFKSGDEAGTPLSGLILDKAGNLYGTTQGGGGSTACSVGCGTVFKLHPNSDGSWTESVLYGFCVDILNGCSDGSRPQAGLIFDMAGNLYGTTREGGSTGHGYCFPGCGVVFKLAPNSDGSWTESVLYSFTGPDGAEPLAGLVFDAKGNLYGTTALGGNGGSGYCSGCGAVFKLSPQQDGSWTESVVYAFTGYADGSYPVASLVFDVIGNLYGTTKNGGRLDICSYGCGAVFKLHPNSDGSWTESVLHAFTNKADGGTPVAGLIFDGAGNLYGTTFFAGDYTGCYFGCGVVFRLTPKSDGSWTERVLHTFLDHPAANPAAGLILDGAGNLYGTTCGSYQCGFGNNGTVFKMAPNSDGGWTYIVLHEFLGKPAKTPVAGLVLDTIGNLYGTSEYCGSTNCQGAVFEITP